SAHAETIPGSHLYVDNCSACHNNKGYSAADQTNVPTLAALQAMTPERIYAAITTGPMKAMAEKLNDDQKRDLVETLSGRVLGAGDSADAKKMPNRCKRTAIEDPLKGARWEGWGNGLENARYQSAQSGKLDAANVGKLKFKWAFGFPGGVNAYGQPTIAGG